MSGGSHKNLSDSVKVGNRGVAFTAKSYGDSRNFKSRVTFHNHTGSTNAGTGSGSTRTIIGNKRPFAYFCDHYKMSSHSMDRCWKIHGYRAGHKFAKGKRVVAVAQMNKTVVMKLFKLHFLKCNAAELWKHLIINLKHRSLGILPVMV